MAGSPRGAQTHWLEPDEPASADGVLATSETADGVLAAQRADGVVATSQTEGAVNTRGEQRAKQEWWAVRWPLRTESPDKDVIWRGRRKPTAKTIKYDAVWNVEEARWDPQRNKKGEQVTTDGRWPLSGKCSVGLPARSC